MHRIYFKPNKGKCQWNLCLLNTIEKRFCYTQRHNAKHPEGIKNERICLFIIVAHTITQFLHSHKLHCIGVISEGTCSQEDRGEQEVD